MAGTYTVLTTQEESSHHQVDIHPPGIDPIKPVDFHNPPQSRTNDTLLHVGVREAPVDVDIAKVQNFSSIGIPTSFTLYTPNIIILILYAVLNLFPKMLTRKICLKIESLFTQ